MSDWAVGVDVGGTKTAAALVNTETGETIHKRLIASRPTRSPQQIVRSIEGLIEACCRTADAHSTPVDHVAVGIPEIVAADGTVLSDQTFPWKGTHLSELLSVDYPLNVDSDVRAAARAEARFGAAKGYPLFVYVSLGTGISSSIVVDGEPLVGAHGAALVLASGRTSELCDRRLPQFSYVLEEIASGLGMSRLYNGRTGERVTGADEVIKRAVHSDPVAAEIVECAALLLGQAIARLVDIVDPQIVVVGGGLGSAETPFLTRMIESVRRHVWLPEAKGVPVVRAALGPDAGIVGVVLAPRAGRSVARRSSR